LKRSELRERYERKKREYFVAREHGFEWEVNACIMLLREDPETFWSFEKCFDGDDSPDDYLEGWR
jgi:hypothetical protein